MDPLALVEHSEGKDTTAHDKSSNERKNGGSQINSGVATSTRVESTGNNKRPCVEQRQEAEVADDDPTQRKKKKENEEPLGKPVPVARGPTGRILIGTKQPGPASKTGAIPLGKSSTPQNKGGSVTSGKGIPQTQAKWGGAGVKTNASNAHQDKSGGTKGGSNSQAGKQDSESPVANQPSQDKDRDGDGEDQNNHESSAPKVPPLKIVIPGGASGSGSRNEPEGEGGSGHRGSGKARGGASTLPYVMPCTSTDFGQASANSDCNYDENRSNESTKAGPKVLRSHRTNDGERGDKERTSSQTGRNSRSRSGKTRSLSSNKSPRPSGSGQDSENAPSTSSRSESISTSSPATELVPRKRKVKASKESHSREPSKSSEPASENIAHAHSVTHANPYQMYIHIRNQIANRQKSLFPVKPKPPKDFHKYLMNRCTYTLQSNVNQEPQVQVPVDLPPLMLDEFMFHEKERSRLRIQHLVEKEKLVLAVEQEILRVHGRAERAVANQSLPFSVCTILRDAEVYNLLAPEQEEKRNAQRSRCNGRQINAWLQEVDDKWEKIKEGMLRRQHTEAQSLHAVQAIGWEWNLKDFGLCDKKSTPQINPKHVPQIHVSNFDLPA